MTTKLRAKCRSQRAESEGDACRSANEQWVHEERELSPLQTQQREAVSQLRVILLAQSSAALWEAASSIRLSISSRCTATSLGALTPTRTWLPFTPSTVMVTSSPIISDSPTRRVKISMTHFLVVPVRLSLMAGSLRQSPLQAHTVDSTVSSPKAECRLRTASSRYFSSMITEILISDVLII